MTGKKRSEGSSEQLPQDETDREQPLEEQPLEEQPLEDENQIAELVTDVIKKEPELLQKIMQDEEVRQQLVMIQQKSYRGPLPPSELLAGYEKFCPGSTERFICQLEVNQKHQHSIESSALNAGVERDKDNRKNGFILTILVLFCSFILGLCGHDWLAGTMATTTIVAILTTFILNKVPERSGDRKQEPSDKQPPSPPAPVDKK